MTVGAGTWAWPSQPVTPLFGSKPQDGQTVVDDLIKGQVVFDNQILDDVIILQVERFSHL